MYNITVKYCLFSEFPAVILFIYEINLLLLLFFVTLELVITILFMLYLVIAAFEVVIKCCKGM